MNVFISVVSHGHGELIKDLDVLSSLNQHFKVVVKNNVSDEILKEYSIVNNIELIDDEYFLGFGENNNRVFSYVKNKYDCKDDDFFIVLNPDVDLKVDSVLNLISDMKNDKTHIAGINLYKDKEFNEYDNSVRKFPGFLDFFSSILGFGNKTIINKCEIDSPKVVDWVAGSFIAFTCKHFNILRGFDEHYFMYCEDIDICFRSYLIGFPVVYYPYVKAIHLAQHANRSIFSKHFRWHVKSATRFLFKKYKMMAK